MELKLFDKPNYAAGRPGDAAWYKEREVSDHIHQEGMHRGRLLEAADLIEHTCKPQASISDWGAGNGGLLHELTKRGYIAANMWGYDMSPLAVEHGRKNYGLQLSVLDVVNDAPHSGMVIVLTEFLEHIVSPHDLLWKARFCWRGLEDAPELEAARWIVASSPANENHLSHYEYHLWAWTGDSFAQMFERTGWRVVRHYCRADVNTQFILAERR